MSTVWRAIGCALGGCLALACTAPRPSTDDSVAKPRGEVPVVLSQLDLRERSFDGARLFRSNFAGSNVSGGSFRGALLDGSDLRAMRAVQTDFQGAQLGHCLMQQSELMGADLRRASLVAANLRHADLRGASLAGADVTRADFDGAHLMGAKLGHAIGFGRESVRRIACFDGATEWPAGVVVEEAKRTCPLHD